MPMLMLRKLVWGVLATMAAAYAVPYNYFKSPASGWAIATFGFELLDAHVITFFIGLAVIPAALAARGRSLGMGSRIVLYGAAALALLLVALNAAGYASSDARSAGPGFYIQVVAALGAVALAVVVGRSPQTAAAAAAGTSTPA